MPLLLLPKVHFPRSYSICLMALLCASLPLHAQTAPAQSGEMSELAATYNDAMTAFNGGDWAQAIAGLEKVITMIVDPIEQGKMAPIYFTLGAAYFNAATYPKAIETFQNYLTKFPQAERIIEVRLALARASFLHKDYAAAAKLFAQLETVPALREQALVAQAACYQETGQTDEQIGVLERSIAPEIKTPAQAGSALTLANLHLDRSEPEKTLGLVNQLFARVALVNNVVALNALAVKLGDALAGQQSFASALAAYRAVRTREQVIAFQNERIAAMEKRMQATLDAARGNAQAFMSATAASNEIKAQRDAAKQLLDAFEKLPDYLPSIIFRMGKVWYDWDKKWEAVVVFNRLLATFPQAKEREPALYAAVTCVADLVRVERTQKLCQQYLKEFPDGPNAPTVGFLLGSVSLQANDPKSAAAYFGTMLDQQPGSPFREQLRMGLGNARFMQGEFANAREDYRRYLQDHPTGVLVEEARYREALMAVYLGEYEEALGALNAYLAAYPEGGFAADAGYRVMVCKYAGSLYDEVVADAAAWQKKHPNAENAGEVFALLGDALAAKDQHAEAAAAYTSSYKKATTDEVLNYSIFEASKQLQKLGKWPEVAEMFTEFIKAKPDHPTVVAAMFWVGRAKAREGKTEEAKTFLVEQLKRYLNEPKREAVEQLLQQLAQLCSKRPRPAAAPVVSTDPAATPAPYDATGELKKQLATLEHDANTTGRARLLYAEAELARLRKQAAAAEKIYAQIGEQFKPEELSPVLLAQVGDFLLGKGDRARATVFYETLREDFPKSDYLDFAFVGLGEIALEKKEFPKALELCAHAADELAASKIKEATMGKARALLELGRYDEAKKLFAQVAGIREWRGESTAAAVFYLGEGEARQGRWPEAVAHFQRVFVAYQKFLPWAAKAYVRTAEGFEKMGKRKEAIGHLQEMLRNEKLKDFPETAQAKKMLADWGPAA